jgi:S-adenosylmethionine decarboxylase
MSGSVPAGGNHILADLYGVAADTLRNCRALEALLRRAALCAGAQVVGSQFHSFGAEEGVTGVVLLAESHISIHTWPESGFAAADIFMCGGAHPEQALTHLIQALAPTHQRVEKADRGLPNI